MAWEIITTISCDDLSAGIAALQVMGRATPEAIGILSEGMTAIRLAAREDTEGGGEVNVK